MGVYIKGMELPKEGTVIAVYKLNGKFYASVRGTELCPIVPVPEHGRLIDADDVIETIWAMRRTYQMMDDTQTADKIMHGLYRAEQAVMDADTIIPPEGATHDQVLL